MDDDQARTDEGKGVLSRRRFLELAAAGAAAGALGMMGGCAAPQGGASQAQAGAEQPAGGQQAEPPAAPANPAPDQLAPTPSDETIRYDVVDSHLHYVDFLQQTDGYEALVAAMDSCGVSQAVIFGMAMAKQWDEDADQKPSYYLSNDSRCYYYSGTDFITIEQLKAQPAEVQARFLPFVCGVNPNDRLAVDHIAQLLDMHPDTFCGIGEFMSRHDDLTALTYGEPPHLDHPAFFAIFDLAAERGLPVLVHHNITAANTPEVLYLDELKAALAHNRDAKIIWAHIGISRRVEVPHLASIADGLLSENENLWIDISWIVYNYYFLEENPDGFEDGDSMDDWAALMEKWPDRFMVGTDKVGHWETYPGEVTKYYALLDKLAPETARKICHDNILGLVKRYA